MDSKVDGIIKTMYTEHLEEFYFKLSVPDGYRLKTTEPSSIDGAYLTEAEVYKLLKKLHIRTETIVHKIFKLDHEKELEVHKLIYYVHELGAVKEKFSKANATKEDLVNVVNHLRQITKDKELAEIDVEGIQQEELYNIIHKKHLEYLGNYTAAILTEVISGS